MVDKIEILKEKRTDLSWNDFAILVRANDQAEIFCQALRWREIPYQFLASSGLFNKPVILDILAYLKLLDNYHESPALYRILTSSIFDPSTSEFKNEQLINLVRWANRKSQSLYQALKSAASIADFSPGAIGEIQKLLGWIDKHSQLARSQSVGKVVFSFLDDTGYLKLLSQKAEKGESTSDRENLENIGLLNQFFKKIEDFEQTNPDKSAKHFTATIEMIMEAGDAGTLQIDLEEGPESVKVMTVHGAKGLEFAYVFVVNLVERRFPTIERKEGIELPDVLMKEIIPEGDIHLQEERRLFYVAMTRAKEGLFLTSAEDYGGLRKKKPSPFLYELNLIKQEEETVKKKTKDISQPTFRYLHLGSLDNQRKNKTLLHLPSKFSFSQLRAFETCPLQYKFSFILRIPRRGKASLSFGQTMHQTLYNFFHPILEKRQKPQTQLFKENKKSEKIEILPLDELLKIYEACWIDDWYQNKSQQEQYKILGKKILKEFHQTVQKDPPNLEHLELDFNFKLEQFTIKGKIDRVDRLEDGSYEITDYKTGKPKDKNLESEDKEQLLIYQLAGQDLFREEIKKLTYHYLDNNSKISFLGDDKELEQMKQKMIKTIKEIQQSDFPPKPGMMCKYCDFFSICEYRKI